MSTTSRKIPTIYATTTGWVYLNPHACRALGIREGDFILIENFKIKKVNEFQDGIQVSRHGAVQRPGCRVANIDFTNELFKRVEGKPIKKGLSIKLPLICEDNCLIIDL